MLFEKGMLYKGYTIQPYSPMAGTGLSSHELNQPGTYKDVTDTTITAQFKTLKESLPKAFQKEIPLYFLAWTTTPWTLPSNLAIAVNEDLDYLILTKDGENLIIGEFALEKYSEELHGFKVIKLSLIHI